MYSGVPVFGDNLFANCQSQTSAVCFTIGDKWFKQISANTLWDARTVINNANLQPSCRQSGCNIDFALIRQRLRTIAQEIHQYALDPVQIKIDRLIYLVLDIDGDITPLEGWTIGLFDIFEIGIQVYLLDEGIGFHAAGKIQDFPHHLIHQAVW